MRNNKIAKVKKIDKPIEIKEEKKVNKFVAVKNPMPFNLEEAKKGAQLITRSGHEAKFIEINELGPTSEKLVCSVNFKNCLVDVKVYKFYYLDGKKSKDIENADDIFLNIESKEIWVRLYYNITDYNTGSHIVGQLHTTEKEALDADKEDKERLAADDAELNNLVVPPFKIFMRK